MNKKFLVLSSINIIPAVWLGGGLTLDTLVLVGFLAVLVVNHSTLVKMVYSLSESMKSSEASSRHLRRVLMLFGFKMLVLGGAVAVVFFYNKALISKVMIIMIFQLIIQVVSIKNNHQFS